MGLKPNKKVTHDIKVISPEYLIENIELAYNSWKENPWATSYSFENFKEYILPYRNLIAPLEDWRKDYQNLAYEIIQNATIDDSNDPVEVCSALVSGLDNMSFVNKRIDPIPILSPQQMLFRKQGSCPDLANFSVFLCRAVGLATTFDYTPHYASSSNRHFWNTVIDKEGNHIPFNSNALNQSDESLPYVYNPNRKRLGKVYRKTYSLQKSALACKVSKDKIPAGFLNEKNIIDVTKEYVPVTDLKINANQFEENIGFVNVYNLSKWKVIGFGEKDDDKMVFKDLGREVVYLPSYLKSKKMKYSTYPYVIDKKGSVKELVPSQDRKTVTISRENEYKNGYKDFNTVEILDGDSYNLYYWKNGWNSLGNATADKGKLTFNNVPANALYLLLPKTPDKFERIFTLEEGTNTIFWY